MSCEQPTDFARDNPNDFASDIFRPDQPASLDVRVLSDSTVKLEWTHQNSDPVKYEIQVSVDNGPFSVFAKTDAGVSELSGSLQLNLDSEYKFRIAGVKGAQKSNFTEAESFVFRVNPPEALTVGGSESSEAELDWTSGNDFDTNYIVEVRPAGMDSFTSVGEGIGGTSYVLNNPDPSAETEVRVAAQTERYRSDFENLSIVFEQRPRMLRQVENNFSRDADYLMYSGARRIVKGDGNGHWFINSSSAMEHLAKSINDDLEITLYDENNNLILSFDAYPDLVGSPPSVPPKVLVSSKWNQIIVKYYDYIQIRDFDGNLLFESDTFSSIRDMDITGDENFLIAHYTTTDGLFHERDRKFRVWALPDFAEVSDYHIIREDTPGIPHLTEFVVSPDKRFLAAIASKNPGLYLYRIDEEMNIYDEQFIDLEIENSAKSIIFSYDSRFIFLEYFSPNADENIIQIDLQGSNSYKKLRIGNNPDLGRLKTFDLGPYFLAVHSNITEYSYDYYWFTK